MCRIAAEDRVRRDYSRIAGNDGKLFQFPSEEAKRALREVWLGYPAVGPTCRMSISPDGEQELACVTVSFPLDWTRLWVLRRPELNWLTASRVSVPTAA